jgi:hypothetical protein
VATELNVRLPHVDLARVSGSAHVVRRTEKIIGRSPAGALAVYLTLRGDAWFECADRTYALFPGNALISETDQPFTRGFNRGLEELVVKVDRAALPEVPQLSRPVIASFRGGGSNDQFARTLADIAGRATRTNRPMPADQGTLRDLITALAAGRAAAPATVHRAAARSYIERHLTDPCLGAEQVAAAIGISERQLSRVFAADCSSIPRHILSRRLHLAYSVLAGHTAVTYFSCVFRQHFGHRASDIRR